MREPESTQPPTTQFDPSNFYNITHSTIAPLKEFDGPLEVVVVEPPLDTTEGLLLVLRGRDNSKKDHRIGEFYGLYKDIVVTNNDRGTVFVAKPERIGQPNPELLAKRIANLIDPISMLGVNFISAEPANY